MKRYALILAILGIGSARAEDPPKAVAAEGFDAFKYVVGSFGLKPLDSFDKLQDDPARTLFIVIGDPSLPRREVNSLRRFVRSGGAILLATNSRTDAIWGDLVGIRITGTVSTENPNLEGYGARAERPVIEKFLRKPFVALKSVATVDPAAVHMEPLAENLRVAARFPDGCATRGLPVFAVMREVDDSRSLFLSSSLMFDNEMMMSRQNQNFEFAFLALEWLKGTRRDRVLFLQDGEIVKSLELNIPIPPLPPITPPVPPVPTVEAINSLIRNAEKEDLFNRFILANISLPNLLRTVFVVISIGLLFLLLRRAWKAKYHGAVDLKGVAGIPSHLRSEPSLMDRRHREMIRNGNAWEAGRDVCRSFFESLDPSNPEAWRQQTPNLLNKQGWLMGPEQKKLKLIWRLAYRDAPNNFTLQEFELINSDIASLTHRLKNGSIRLA